MNRILDFTPSEEEALVARVLVLVHQTIDDAFPSAEKATRQFTKTVFSDDSERTAIGRPGDGDQFADVEPTGPTPPPPVVASDVAAAPRGGHQLPTPPGKTPAPPPPPSPAAEKGAPSYASQLNPVNTSSDRGLSGVTNQSTMQRHDHLAGPDWVTRFTLALLIAGLVLLAYALFS